MAAKKKKKSADEIKLFNTNQNNVDVNAGSSEEEEEDILMICSRLRSLSVLALARFTSCRDFSHVMFPSFNFRHS